MSNFNTFAIAETQRDLLVKAIGNFQKENAQLKQNNRAESNETEAKNAAFFLELLEIVDTLDNLVTSLQNNSEALPESYQRLPRAISFVQRKLLSTLQKRDVNAIAIPENTPVDTSLCRIIDSEIRDDLPERSPIRILKQGYKHGDKVLRPAEAIVSKSIAPEK
jgi:molecular chaperone GrpE